MAPIIAFTKNSRWIFLPNVISFLLLPGLLFSMLTRIGVRRKTAWHWIVDHHHWTQFRDAGRRYCQRSIPAPFMRAGGGTDFGLRLRASQRLPDFWLFLLAAALLTGAKASNIPLLLPAFILILPQLRVLLIRPVVNLLMLVFAFMASFAPTAILNWKFCHDWTGMSLEGPMQGPFTQLAINFGTLDHLANFSPPVFPLAGKWNSVS